jgi:hypothetical protein
MTNGRVTSMKLWSYDSMGIHHSRNEVWKGQISP